MPKIIRHDRDALRDCPAINPGDVNVVVKAFCPDADVSLVAGFSRRADFDVVTATLNKLSGESADANVVVAKISGEGFRTDSRVVRAL